MSYLFRNLNKMDRGLAIFYFRSRTQISST